VSTTRLGQIGVGVQPYPGFDPKDPAPTSGPHNPGVITRLAQFGIGLSKYGDFQPKVAVQPVVEQVQGRGSWDAFRQKKKKRGTFIRRSDFESIEAYKESLAKLFPVEPKTQIIEPVSPLDDVDDDEILLIAISRLLH